MRPGPPPGTIKTVVGNTTSLYYSSSSTFTTVPSSTVTTSITSNSTTSSTDVLMGFQSENIDDDIVYDDNSTLELLQDLMPANFSLILEEMNMSITDFLQSDNVGDMLIKIGLEEEPSDGYNSASENLNQNNRTQRRPRRVFRGGSRKHYKKGGKVNANDTSHNATMSKLSILTKLLENKSHNYPNGVEIPRVDFTKINLALPTIPTKPQVIFVLHTF